MKHYPILMEAYFTPGFKISPAVHVGSQTLHLFHGNAEDQAWEGVNLAAAQAKDIAVVRNMETENITYWQDLMGKISILNIVDTNGGEYLSQIILDDEENIEWIKTHMAANSTLMIFFPTNLEQELAKRLGIPLHGSPEISDIYGIKSGIRKLAQENDIPMAPGFICTTYKQAQQAVNSLRDKFEYIVVKHDASVSGLYSKKLATKGLTDIKKEIKNLTGQSLIEGRDIFVIEGWLKSKASLCAHIEIIKGQEPIVCAAWQQVIDTDGISYIGAGPLMLSQKALQAFIFEVNKLAKTLQAQGAIGSFGPDFLITADDETNFEPDTCMLIELNARVPYTAFPLEVIKQIKHTIGSGFYTHHIKLKKNSSFKDIVDALKREKLLITHKASNAKGVVPYNTELLRWNLFDIVIMADTWEETMRIDSRVKTLFNL